MLSWHESGEPLNLGSVLLIDDNAKLFSELHIQFLMKVKKQKLLLKNKLNIEGLFNLTEIVHSEIKLEFSTLVDTNKVCLQQKTD